MTRVLYKSTAQMRFTFKITTIKANGRITSKLYEGNAFMHNALGEYNNKGVYIRAKKDALYQYYNDNDITVSGSPKLSDIPESVTIEPLHYEINYKDDFAKVKRKKVLRFDKRTKKKGYWNEVRRLSDGKLISRTKWRVGEDVI